MLLGNLGADPETRTTGNGTVVANLRLAVGERVKRNGEWEDHTEWFRVVCFGKTAENAAKYLGKGSQCAVQGRMRTQKWTDKDGNDRWTTEIICDRLTFVGKKGEVSGGSSDAGGYQGGNSRGGQGSGGGNSGGGADDSDIPF